MVLHLQTPWIVTQDTFECSTKLCSESGSTQPQHHNYSNRNNYETRSGTERKLRKTHTNRNKRNKPGQISLHLSEFTGTQRLPIYCK